MSLAFSDTTNKDGIIQGLERTLFGDNGDARISGDTTLLAYFTNDVNLALDKAFSLIFRADGRWQFDDRNHTDYPIITTNIVANQRDYSFTVDGNSNLILEIQKVAILQSATATVYQEIEPVDAQTEKQSHFVANDTTRVGVPWKYDKTANGIFLDPIPDYAATNGLKLYISREGNYFTVADTTQMPGFAGIFHEYCVLRPAYQYAYRNGLTNANALREEMLLMEKEMEEFYGKRAKDERFVMTPKKNNYV
jgi:hypothetical protein